MMPSPEWYHDVHAELAALRRRVDQLQDRPALWGRDQQIRLAKTVAGPTTYPKAHEKPNTYWIVHLDGTFSTTAGRQTATVADRAKTDDPFFVAHEQLETYRWENDEVWVVWQNGRWWIVGPTPRLVGFELAEDHPGRGILFDVWVGQWSKANHQWDYDYSGTVKCIDWRYDVPYPAICATGLGEWRKSTTYGRILEVVALDCSSPGCYH